MCKINPFTELKTKITNLDFEIKSHFFATRKQSVRKGILPGNSKTLWQAVKHAKNLGQIPQNMTLNKVQKQKPVVYFDQ